MKKYIVLALFLAACGQTGSQGPQGASGSPGLPGAAASPQPTITIICNGDDTDNAYTVTYNVFKSCANVNVVGNHCGWSGSFYAPGSFGFNKCNVKFDGQIVTCYSED